MPTRGFVTIATGNEKYYRLAENLLRSYRLCTANDLPFAIICDRENEITRQFDRTVIMETPSGSYMDKLLLYRYAPYDETIFIDADSLILSDLSGLWEDFADADDVSCYGCVHPLDSEKAWFTYDGCGEYQKDIHYLIDLHGGIYYLRKTDRCWAIFEKAIELAGEYSRYSFRNFEKPADEPVLAMSLAIHGSRPCDKKMRILFVPSFWGKLRINHRGEVFVEGHKLEREIIHFSTANTQRFLYHYLADCIGGNQSMTHFWRSRLKFAPREMKAELRHWVGGILRKVMPDGLINRLKERI